MPDNQSMQSEVAGVKIEIIQDSSMTLSSYQSCDSYIGRTRSATQYFNRQQANLDDSIVDIIKIEDEQFSDLIIGATNRHSELPQSQSLTSDLFSNCMPRSLSSQNDSCLSSSVQSEHSIPTKFLTDGDFKVLTVASEQCKIEEEESPIKLEETATNSEWNEIDQAEEKSTISLAATFPVSQREETLVVQPSISKNLLIRNDLMPKNNAPPVNDLNAVSQSYASEFMSFINRCDQRTIPKLPTPVQPVRTNQIFPNHEINVADEIIKQIQVEGTNTIIALKLSEQLKIPYITIMDDRAVLYYECADCRKQYQTKNRFAIHLKSHFIDHHTPCNECRVICGMREKFKMHAEMHAMKILLDCLKCIEMSQFKILSYRHFLSHIKIDSKSRKLLSNKLILQTSETISKSFDSRSDSSSGGVERSTEKTKLNARLTEKVISRKMTKHNKKTFTNGSSIEKARRQTLNANSIVRKNCNSRPLELKRPNLHSAPLNNGILNRSRSNIGQNKDNNEALSCGSPNKEDSIICKDYDSLLSKVESEISSVPIGNSISNSSVNVPRTNFFYATDPLTTEGACLSQNDEVSTHDTNQRTRLIDHLTVTNARTLQSTILEEAKINDEGKLILHAQHLPLGEENISSSNTAELLDAEKELPSHIIKYASSTDLKNYLGNKNMQSETDPPLSVSFNASEEAISCRTDLLTPIDVGHVKEQRSHPRERQNNEQVMFMNEYIDRAVLDQKNCQSYQPNIKKLADSTENKAPSSTVIQNVGPQSLSHIQYLSSGSEPRGKNISSSNTAELLDAEKELPSHVIEYVSSTDLKNYLGNKCVQSETDTPQSISFNANEEAVSSYWTDLLNPIDVGYVKEQRLEPRERQHNEQVMFTKEYTDRTVLDQKKRKSYQPKIKKLAHSTENKALSSMAIQNVQSLRRIENLSSGLYRMIDYVPPVTLQNSMASANQNVDSQTGLIIVQPNPITATQEDEGKVFDKVVFLKQKLGNPRLVKNGKVRFNSDNSVHETAPKLSRCTNNTATSVHTTSEGDDQATYSDVGHLKVQGERQNDEDISVDLDEAKRQSHHADTQNIATLVKDEAASPKHTSLKYVCKGRKQVTWIKKARMRLSVENAECKTDDAVVRQRKEVSPETPQRKSLRIRQRLFSQRKESGSETNVDVTKCQSDHRDSSPCPKNSSDVTETLLPEESLVPSYVESRVAEPSPLKKCICELYTGKSPRKRLKSRLRHCILKKKVGKVNCTERLKENQLPSRIMTEAPMQPLVGELNDQQCAERMQLIPEDNQSHTLNNESVAASSSWEMYKRTENSANSQWSLNSSYDDFAYKCTECILRFPSSEELAVHKKFHKRCKYICIACKEKFPSITSLSFHMKLHKDLSGFTCNICGERFTFQASLAMHLRHHIKCHQCGVSCETNRENKKRCKQATPIESKQPKGSLRNVRMYPKQPKAPSVNDATCFEIEKLQKDEKAKPRRKKRKLPIKTPIVIDLEKSKCGLKEFDIIPSIEDFDTSDHTYAITCRSRNGIEKSVAAFQSQSIHHEIELSMEEPTYNTISQRLVSDTTMCSEPSATSRKTATNICFESRHNSTCHLDLESASLFGVVEMERALSSHISSDRDWVTVKTEELDLDDSGTSSNFQPVAKWALESVPHGLLDSSESWMPFCNQK